VFESLRRRATDDERPVSERFECHWPCLVIRHEHQGIDKPRQHVRLIGKRSHGRSDRLGCGHIVTSSQRDGRPDNGIAVWMGESA
jgi:hypothetical protein